MTNETRAPKPFNEALRLQELLSYDILDTSPEEDFNRITRLASQIFSTPMAIISLLDEHRQWFKSAIGLDVEETPRDLAFCAHTILTDTVMTVPDAHVDPRFQGNALVTGAPRIRFYAGAPLKGMGGFNLGTLCILDTEPRSTLTSDEEQALEDLASLVMTQLELRRIRNKANSPAHIDGQAAQILQSAKDAAERANSAKSAFLSMMGHELRTPLNAIMGFSDLLRTETFGPLGSKQYKEYADTIHCSGQHLLSIVASMLDYSALESGSLVLHEEIFDACVAVQEAASMLDTVAKQSGVELRLNLSQHKTELFADHMQVIQMLSNVIGNAIKFTNAGGHIDVAIEAIPGSSVSIKVSDDGIGIAPDAVHTILSPFTQVDARLCRTFEGCGIGLPLTRALIELHGGTLAIQSQLGTGTQVSLRFPKWRSQETFARIA